MWLATRDGSLGDSTSMFMSAVLEDMNEGLRSTFSPPTCDIISTRSVSDYFARTLRVALRGDINSEPEPPGRGMLAARPGVKGAKPNWGRVQ